MAGILVKRHIAATPKAFAGVQVQTSSYGVGIPIVYGQARIPGNLLYYDDFRALAHKSSAGGKGGGGTVTDYSYQAAIIMGLCEGPIAGIVSVWADQAKDTWTNYQANGYSLFVGASAQAAWSYLTSNHPGAAIPYDRTAYVAHPTWPLGAGAETPNHTWEIKGLLAYGSGIVDALPSDVLQDFLTNVHHGVGFPTAQLAALTEYATYCAAAGLFLSPVIDTQRTAADYLTDLLTATNSAAVWSDGTLKIRPYGDTTIVGTYATYTPDVTPIYDLTDDDYIAPPGVDPVTVERTSPADAYNHIQVEYEDRSNNYAPTIAEAKDDAAISSYELRTAPVVQMHWVHDMPTARLIAQLILQRGLYIRNTYQFTLSWKYCLLEPMDLVTLTDSGLGLSKTPVRITAVEEDENGQLHFTAEEWPFGVASATQYPAQSNGATAINSNVDPGNTAPPVIFEATAPLTQGGPEIWIAASGGPEWGGCEVWLSTDDVSYVHVGTIHGGARYGSLLAPLGAGAGTPGLDLTDTLSVDLSVSGGTLASGSLADCQALNTLCFVDGEFLAYETATLTAASEYALTTLNRGAFASAVVAHAASTPFVRCDQAVFRLPFPQGTPGQQLYFKFPAFNGYGGGGQALSSVSAVPYTFGGVVAPLRPGLLLQDFRVVDEDDTTVTYGWTPGVEVVEVWASIQTFSAPVPADPWAIVAAHVLPISGNTLVVFKPAAGDVTYVQVEARDVAFVAGPVQRVVVNPGQAPLAYGASPQGTVSIDSNGAWSFNIDGPQQAASYRWLASTTDYPTDSDVQATGTIVNGRTMTAPGGAALDFGQTIYITAVPYPLTGAAGDPGQSVHLRGSYQTFTATKTVTFSAGSYRPSNNSQDYASVDGIGFGPLTMTGGSGAILGFTSQFTIPDGCTIIGATHELKFSDGSVGLPGFRFVSFELSRITGTTATVIASAAASPSLGWQSIAAVLSELVTGGTYEIGASIGSTAAITAGNEAIGPFSITYTIPKPTVAV